MNSLNGTWAFRTDPTNAGEAERGSQPGWFMPSANWTNADSLTVPGNWDLRNEYAHYVGKGWYRRTFVTPSNTDQKPNAARVIRLVFEAVYHDCTVWLNGQKLGENHSGFLPFAFEVTDKLNKNEPNTLVVCADNSLTRGAIWNWGGIRRPVSLEITDPLRVVRQHITPTVDLTAKTAVVAVRVFLQNHATQSAEATGTVQLTNPAGFSRSVPFRISVPGSGTASVVVQTTLSPQETHLWHFDDPFLYTSQITLANGEQRTNRFGLRKIELDNTNYQLKLNGETIRPMGFNLVPDDRTTGNTLPLWRIKEDIDLLKSLGCTMTRLAHMCLPDEVMDYLDERGILVISEIPLWGYDRFIDPANPTAKDWLTRLITNQYNHPSVIGWSVGNEYGDYPTAMAYTQEAVAYAKILDSTRLVSCVSHTAQTSPDILDVGDIGLINKYSKNLGQITRKQHELHPGKTLFYTEYGAGQLVENLDGDIDAKALLDSIRGIPYLIGASLWTFNDYRSRFVGTKEVSENRPWGVVDVYRQKKRAYYSFRREHNPLQNLAVSPVNNTSVAVRLEPRRVLDLPAYPLHNYRLLWKRTDAIGRIVQGGLVPLPVIRLGDSPLTLALNWPADTAFAMTLELLAPTGDALADTTIFYRKPLPVAVTYAMSGRSNMNGTPPQSGLVRVHFEKNSTATAYKVRYGTAGLTQETAPTLNPYAEVPRLDFGKTYQLAVVSINGAGESQPTTVQSVTVDRLSLPSPVIQHVEPADGGFYVGYASEADDYLYRVQVTTQPGNYATARMVQTQNPGSLFVPGLTNGKPYWFRIQRVKDNWFAGDWSEEIRVLPDGGKRPAAPVLQGVVRQLGDAVVCFDPVPKATGYALEYRPAGAGGWTIVSVPTAQTGRFVLTKLDPKKSYQVRLATLNASGQSDYSLPVNVPSDAKIRRNR